MLNLPIHYNAIPNDKVGILSHVLMPEHPQNWNQPRKPEHLSTVNNCSRLGNQDICITQDNICWFCKGVW